MNKAKKLILWFKDLSIKDVPSVGGKNASLGEMYRTLASKGVPVPNGFAITAYAYQSLIKYNKLDKQIRQLLKGFNKNNVIELAKRGKAVRQLILDSKFPENLNKEIEKAYGQLCKEYGRTVDVAVRSSATAEDLPDASFAGQQETYLNIKGKDQLLKACKKCFASLFTNRAISYRIDKKFDHFRVSLSIGVQKMVRSDKASSGVMFSIDTDSGFKDVVLINASYGLGENIVQGSVNPDSYFVFKPTLKKGFKPIIEKRVGEKEIKMVYTNNPAKPTKNIPTTEKERKAFVLSDEEILHLAKFACIIEDHYKKPMDMEWAKDGLTDKLFIVQARPETVQSQKNNNIFEDYQVPKKGKVIVTGQSVGAKVGQGKSHVITDVKNINQFKKGEVLVTEMTDPDWEPIMKIASAIVTDRGGRTCFTGDTKILTSKGFMQFDQIFNNHEGLMVPSLNKDSLKIEWKPILATMKRKNDVIEICSSQTGRMQGNNLRLTPDHKMLTFEDGEILSKEISLILKNKEMITLAQKLPNINSSTEKEKSWAYLLGAISTDGSVYLSKNHGEVQFIQKPTEEKKKFIEEVQNCMIKSFKKPFSICRKKASSGSIRGKPAIGEANAYRCYSKQIAIEVLQHKKELVQTLLCCDEEVIYSFLAGVIDGDGSFNKISDRINIYVSKKDLLESIIVSCLRLGFVPQVSVNRSIYNVQIVEKVRDILNYTKRVKGSSIRTKFGTRFFSAKQIFGNSAKIRTMKSRIDKNLLVDETIIKKMIDDFDKNNQEKISKIISSDTRMQRVNFVRDVGYKDVYNITVADNNNYIVFTDRYTPILVNNCHAAIISRELGIPCVVGTNNGTKKIKNNETITVSCADGEEGFVYEGKVPYRIEKINVKNFKKPKTKIMMNIGNPESAFEMSFIPNEGVGLAREEFIINEYIKIHPKALINFDKIKDASVKQQIEKMTYGYKNKADFFVNKLAQGVAMIGAAFYPKDVIVRMSDFKTNEYANLIGGKEYEPKEENPMIGWRGASRYYSDYKDAFALECRAMKKAREEFGLTNIKLMVPFCRTIEEGKKVIAEMEKNGLYRGKDGLQVYVMCEIPSNVILADEFAEIFDGFSIGSNDLTQLTLGLDRDSQLVSHIYNERNMAVKKLIALVISKCRKNNRKIGICGQAPSDFPDFAQFLVECGIDSISLNPDTVVKTTMAILQTEKKLKK